MKRDNTAVDQVYGTDLTQPINKKSRAVKYFHNKCYHNEIDIAKHTWRDCTFSCDTCDWTGKGKTTMMGNIYEDFFEINCPKCNTVCISYINFPSRNEQTFFGTPIEKMLRIKNPETINQTIERLKLKFPDQLPDIKQRGMRVKWLNEGNYIVLRYYANRLVLWRELASPNEEKRYFEIGEILKQKYGKQLMDFIPPQSIDKVNVFRESLKLTNV